MGTCDEGSSFICRLCKPVEIQSRGLKTDSIFKCQICTFTSSFKYSLKRHIQLKHDGIETLEASHCNEIMNPDISKTPSETPPPDPECPTIENMLDDIGLKNLEEHFLSEGVDAKMLLGFDLEELKNCLKEIGIKRFGDRHKITEKVRQIKSSINSKSQKEMEEECMADSPTKSFEGIENEADTPSGIVSVSDILTNDNDIKASTRYSSLNENVTTTENVSSHASKDSPCILCCEATQHPCRLCYRQVCNFCLERDPNSTNEMHRVHVKGHKDCIVRQTFECPFCEQQFLNATALQEHIDNTHADAHESLPSNLASIVSGVSISFGDLRRDSISYSCEHANEYEYEDAEVNTGDDLVSSSLNLEESNELFRKRTKQNLKDISFQDDSDIDEAWTPEEERHECNFCDFVTSYEYSLIRHKKTHEKSKQKSAPKRKLADVESVSNKRKKDDITKERIQTYCNICGKEFANNFSYGRHCLNKHA